MRRLTKGLILTAAILFAGCLATACGQGAAKLSSLSPSPRPSLSASPRPSLSASPQPSLSASPQPSLSPGSSAPATATTQPSATQSAAAPTPTVQPTGSAAPTSGSGSAVIWPWILAGAVVLIGVIILIARAASRRSAAASSWRSRVNDAYAKGSAVYDAMSVAEMPGALSADNAFSRWSDIQRRVDDLTQALYALREAAPDEESRARVSDVLTSLQAVRSGMDAERAPGGAGAQHAEAVRDRLASFEASLRALRAPDDRLS